MYDYELRNNHYIVKIDGKNFLIDIGWPASFGMEPSLREVNIDGVTYPLQRKMDIVNRAKIEKMVGTTIDGFIGEDIIQRTSLTIDKRNKKVSFSRSDEKGATIDYELLYGYVMVVELDEPKGRCIVDTGAMVGYGTHDLFVGKHYKEFVDDYNPRLGDMHSPLFDLDIVIGGVTKRVEICHNVDVEFDDLNASGSKIVVGIHELFNEVFVIDAQRRQIIFR